MFFYYSIEINICYGFKTFIVNFINKKNQIKWIFDVDNIIINKKKMTNIIY